MKLLAAILVTLVLVHLTEAGILKRFGEKTEEIGKKINQGASKVEETIASVFSKKKESSIEDLKENTTETVPTPPPVVEEEEISDDELIGIRFSIDGAPRCAPGEEFQYGACRSVDR